jgi:hypothetical protein
MVEKYIVVELMFLVPLLLCVSMPILKRGQPPEIRFLKFATVLSLIIVCLNIVLFRTGFMFPAFVMLLLLVAAYSIHPSIPGAFVASLVASFAVVGGGAVADWYADVHRGSFADQNHGLVVGGVSLLCGLVAVILCQFAAKKIIHRRPVNLKQDAADL